MNKPILFVLYLSLACSIGFVCGVYFGGFYTRDIVFNTIRQHGEVEDLIDWYGMIIQEKQMVEQLSTIEGMHGVQTLREKHIQNGLSNIRIFREQAKKIKKDASNPQAIFDLEESVSEIETAIFNNWP